MEPGVHLTDHAMGALLALMAVLLAVRAPSAPTADQRLAFYWSAAMSSVALTVAVFATWVIAGRSLATFGLFAWDVGFDRAVVVIGAWILFLLLAVGVICRGLLREPLLRIYRRYETLMPVTRRELGASWLTSLFAGSGEEIVFRGFLMWYLATLTNPWVALAGSSLLFGLAHGYQSRLGMMFATAAGLVLGGVYLATGSLPLVMAMHATYNMASFVTGRHVLRAGRTLEVAA